MTKKKKQFRNYNPVSSSSHWYPLQNALIGFYIKKKEFWIPNETIIIIINRNWEYKKNTNEKNEKKKFHQLDFIAVGFERIIIV